MIVDLRAVEAASRDIDRLRATGWSFVDQPHRILVEGEVASPGEARVSLACFENALTALRVRGTYGEFWIELGLFHDKYEVVQLLDGNLERFFEEPGEREAARRLEDREPDAALELPLTWRASADLDLGRLPPVVEGLDVRVVLSSEWLTSEVNDAGITGLMRLVPAGGLRRVYVALSVSHEAAHFGSISFVGLTDEADVPLASNPLPGEDVVNGSLTPPPSALSPLGQVESGGPWAGVARICAAAFVASTWHRFATSVQEKGQVVEFLGFKRVAARLPLPEQLLGATIVDTQRLYRWAFQDLSPDRLLAIRQVVSLYQDDVALLRPEDVLASAEVVFVGLRTEAVAEVLRGTREAQAQAADSVRQSLKAVQDLTKSATERVLASLVAVAAVVAAHSTRTLSDEVGRNLLLIVAAFLLLLALFDVILEGPLLSLPLRKLDEDLREGNPMLTETQQQRAVQLPSVLATRRRVLLLRLVVPATYLGLATAIVIWGYPQRFS
jgi:hypothetical protein